jgi:hypothetical protein
MAERSYAGKYEAQRKMMNGLWRGKRKKREGSYLTYMREVLGDGVSRGNHVTSPTTLSDTCLHLFKWV